jgi:hypothetical protein
MDEHRVTGNNETPPAEEAQWTVLFYGSGTSAADIMPDGQSRMIASVQGLERVFPSEQVHAMALLGTTLGDGHCRFMEIGFRPDDIDNEISATVLGDWGVQDMSSPTLLQQFADSALQRYPASRYVLIVGGDGDGWKGSCRDDVNGSGHLLTHPEMDAVIEQLTEPDGHPFHADLLLWLTPGMGNLEIAYEFRNVADYVIAAPSVAAQPGFMALNQWYLDLNLNPQMSAERLGQFMVSRMQQKALASHDSLATFDLMDISQIPDLADAVDHLSNAFAAALPSHGAAILTLWQELWDERTDDSSCIDLKSFARALLADSSFATDTDVLSAAHDVENGLEQVASYQRTTRADANRDGVMIYAPLQANPAEMSQYDALRLSVERPAWVNFLNTMQTAGPALVQVTGQVSWAGRELQDLYLFLNTAHTGAPTVYLATPVTITNVITPAQVEFLSTFAMTDDSVSAYLGAFQDLDHSQTLTSGDRFGYYHHNSPSRDWLTVHNGDQLDSVQIVLTNTL